MSTAPAPAPPRSRADPARVAAVAFGVLVVATFAAFFVAQRLKNTPSVIQQLKINTGGRGARIFSPNRDGRRDRVRFSLMLKKADRVTLMMVDAQGDSVKTLVDDRALRAFQRLGLPGIPWDGTDDAGRPVPDGRYKLRIILRNQGRSVLYPSSILKDTTPPRPRVMSIGPQKAPGPELLPEAGGARVHFAPALDHGVIHVFRTAPGRVREVLRTPLTRGETVWRWDGRVAGRRASPGTYLVVLEWRDAAGNIGTSVPLDRRGLPVLGPGRLAGRGGITVRYLGARAPVAPVTARDPVRFDVDSRTQRYTWDIRRLGAPRPRKRGGPKTKPGVTTTAPGGASGVYLFEARTRTHATRVPFAVQARPELAGTASRPRGVLVVLPVITWQGRNPVDDDGDGAPNVLDTGGPAGLYRVAAGDGLPAGFTEHEAPVLQWLDRSGRRYDLTTDAALLAGTGPRLTGHRGVLIPGDARWLPAALRAGLRSFARRGGTVVSLGTDSLRRSVRLDADGEMSRPSAPQPTDAFGERVSPLVKRATSLEIFQDDRSVLLFGGATGLIADVPAWEATQGGLEADLVSRAVTVAPVGRNVVVAARFEKGLLVRPGFPAFGTRLSTHDPAVTALMARMWTLLRR